MLAPDRLEQIAGELAEAVEFHYAAEGKDLPERRFFVASPQQEVLDCEMFTVSCEGTYGSVTEPDRTETIGKLGEAGYAMRAAVFTLTISRCGPRADDDGLTDDDDETEVARLVWQDGTLMLNGIVAAHKAGSLPSCGRVVFLDWRTTPQPSTVEWSTLRVAIGLLRG